MPDDRLPFESRDLIRHLPELLAGPEPLLESARARELLRGDPLAEASLLAVAEAVNAMAAGSSAVSAVRRGRHASAARPVAQAARCFARELAGVFFDLGRAYVDRAVRGEMWLAGAETRGGLENAAQRRLEILGEVAPVLRSTRLHLRERRWLGRVERLLDRSDRGSLLRAARDLFTAFTRLQEAADGARWYLLFIRELTEPNLRAEEWERFAGAARSLDNRARGWEGAARLWSPCGRPDRSVRLDLDARQILPNSPVLAFAGLYHALLAGMPTEAHFFRERLESLGEGTSDWALLYADQARGGRPDWIRIREERSALYNEVIGRMTPEMRHPIEEAASS